MLALLSLGLLALLLVWSDGPRVRYANMGCQYRLIYATQGPVGAVVLGTSRAQRGIAPDVLAASLGGSAVAINLARGGRGPGQLYQQLLDLESARGITGPIVFEYTPESTAFWRSTPLYYQYLQNFGAHVPLDAYIDDWRAKPREPSYARLHDLFGHVRTRIDLGLETLLTGAWRKNATVRAGQARSEGCMTPAGRVQTAGQRRQLHRRAVAVERQVGADGSWRDLPPVTNDLWEINQDSQNFYVGEVIDFARRHRLPVAFVAMPGYLGAPPSAATLTAFEEQFGVPLLYPPLGVREELADEADFQDAYHLNPAGARIYTQWLARVLRDTPPPP